ncbi:MAG: cyclodeaminase [Alphaproteobacteria bacterium]|nr:cyclodeaminase [Alphaproteobacteria bacterium]
MPDIKLYTERDLRDAVPLDLDAIACVEEAFRALATKEVVMPPILSMHIAEHNGEVDVKTAYVPGIDSFAIKMSPGFFDNPKYGLPSVNGLMVLFSATTGLVEAVLLDNGYLTDVRTAAAGAVAARWLARPDATQAGIIGSGTQARLQLKALSLVRNIERAVIWGRDDARARKCAEDCASELGIDVTAVATVGDVMATSDIVVTTTPSSEPLIDASQLRPGQHITAMGSDADYKTELAPDVIAAVDRYVCDHYAQCLKQGELRAAVAAGSASPDLDYSEIGAVIEQQDGGRDGSSDITVCDLTGTGVQDTAIAAFARSRALAAGTGTTFTSDE